ncbi:hypothetical protein QTJ16_000674 [Diplocarpon rosae]|uniref:Opioid growth factor receptor (OGFr) conserved domain-containing protein n=1 Tax=Diplocarpon rosae TaxID=946125 RepID=A0AAD9WHS2_9HELO|nr:hypothetical protein QTJ16_000674 [Diplocarpon rosae]
MRNLFCKMSKRKASQAHEARAKMNLLIPFYEGTETDRRGRSLTEILQWSASQLEASHDYIQILFPLPEESGVNWNAPVIDRQVFDAFRSRPELKEKLRDSFRKMLWFYGFELQTEGGVKVTKGPNYNAHSSNWDVRFDHNHLRITRIIRCLRILGLEDEAQAFRAALEEATMKASSRSREYWRRAAERALNLRPDLEEREIEGEDELTVGPKFLREFEECRKLKAKSGGKSDRSGTSVGADQVFDESDKFEQEVATGDSDGLEVKNQDGDHADKKIEFAGVAITGASDSNDTDDLIAESTTQIKKDVQKEESTA